MKMAALIGEIYDALKEAGVPDDKARQAARAVAGAEELKEIRSDLREIRNAIQDTRGDVRVLKWMPPFTLTILVAILFRVLSW
jgi:hypothetical protein